MKKILNYSFIAILAVVVLASCSKNDHIDNYNESGIVAFADNTPYSVISFDDGTYAVMQAMENNTDYWPYFHDVITGNFQNTGSRSFYNESGKVRFNALILSFANNYNDALDDCNYYRKQGGYSLITEKAFLEKANMRVRIK